MTPSTPPTSISSPREQAAAWSLTLSTLSPAKPLTKDNPFVWLSKIKAILKSLHLKEFLDFDGDKNGTDEATSASNSVIRGCLVVWMLANMDENNEMRFRAKITTYTATGSEVQDLPSALWHAVHEHYTSQIEATQMLLRNAIDSIEQANGSNLLTHLDNFDTAVIRYRSSGGSIDDKELGCKLLASLNPARFNDAREILRSGAVEYDSVVLELKRCLDSEVVLGGKACTTKECYGHTQPTKHTPDQCFHKLGNEEKLRKRVQSKKRARRSEDYVQCSSAKHHEISPSLSSMPLEIKDCIAHYVRSFGPQETAALLKEKSKRTRALNRGYSAYTPKSSDIPILSSFQSLAVVDRDFYDICRPLLWAHLKFPSSSPGTMQRWTRDILFTHGHHVRSISFEPARIWLRAPPPNISHDNDCDNLRFAAQDFHRGLSYENTVKVLSTCPNLCSLKITVPTTDFDADMSLFYTSIGSILQYLPTLRHLILENWTSSTPDEPIACIIKMLPLLETFECEDFTTQLELDQSMSAGSFGFELAHLKHLSKLGLHYCESINAKWCDQVWPATLTNLALMKCPNLLIPDARKLIEQFATSLVNLEFELEDSDLPHEWPVKNQFHLPVLQKLELGAPNALNLLESFKNCKALQQISWWYVAPSEWAVLQRLVLAVPTWPDLKFLDITRAQPYNPTSWEINSALYQLKAFCHNNGITFCYPGRPDATTL